MSAPKFNVKINDYQVISSIDGGWTSADYKKLLTEMDFDSSEATSTQQLHELCLMCLQDREKEESAAIVMKYRLGDKLTDGQIQNESVELADEKLWEQFADLSLHEQLFHVGSLMYQAFPDSYHTPDAIKLTVELESQNEVAKELLSAPLHESLLVRLLASGMDASAILHRLFDDQLTSNSFPEATSIIWIVNPVSQSGKSVTVEIISSAHWLDALKEVESFEAEAAPDETPVAG